MNVYSKMILIVLMFCLYSVKVRKSGNIPVSQQIID